jgi:hypothetical protein
LLSSRKGDGCCFECLIKKGAASQSSEVRNELNLMLLFMSPLQRGKALKRKTHTP